MTCKHLEFLLQAMYDPHILDSIFGPVIYHTTRTQSQIRFQQQMEKDHGITYQYQRTQTSTCWPMDLGVILSTSRLPLVCSAFCSLRLRYSGAATEQSAQSMTWLSCEEVTSLSTAKQGDNTFGSVRLSICGHSNFEVKVKVQGQAQNNLRSNVWRGVVARRNSALSSSAEKTYETLSPKTFTISSPRTVSVISCCFDWLHVSGRSFFQLFDVSSSWMLILFFSINTSAIHSFIHSLIHSFIHSFSRDKFKLLNNSFRMGNLNSCICGGGGGQFNMREKEYT